MTFFCKCRTNQDKSVTMWANQEAVQHFYSCDILKFSSNRAKPAWLAQSSVSYTFGLSLWVRSGAGAGIAGGAGAAPKVQICRKFEQNLHKIGHRSFNNIVSCWVINESEVRKTDFFLQNKFFDSKRKHVINFVFKNSGELMMSNQILEKFCREKVRRIKYFGEIWVSSGKISPLSFAPQKIWQIFSASHGLPKRLLLLCGYEKGIYWGGANHLTW